jgi:nucleotidyltransferase substrate binding protein (TIGR01987 family)
MERLQERVVIALKALKAFEAAMKISEPSDIERDAAIQRFEFTFEAIWKTAKEMLFVVEGIDQGSPKGVIRSCREIDLLNDRETVQLLKMVDDRNLTVHTYNEALAEEIYNNLPGYLSLMSIWIQRIKKRSRL